MSHSSPSTSESDECLQDKLDQATEINEEGVDYIRRLLGV